jgi:MFS family permease
MVVLDNTILNVALPHIARALDARQRDLQWITAAYGLVLAGLLLPFGVMGDHRGRKGMLMIGLTLFGAASALAATSTSTTALIFARGLQGVGGACTMPATLSLVGNLFSQRERGKAIAIWSAVAGVAGAAGPALGGLLLARFWWGSVFLVNVPVALAGVVAAAFLVPPSKDPTRHGVNRTSALTWWGALTATLVAIIELPSHGFGSPLVIGAAAVALTLFMRFPGVERRTTSPLIDADTVHDPRMLAGGAVMAALFFAMFGSQFVVTQWLQGPRHLTAFAAGMSFVPGALASIGSPLANPPLVARYGHRAVAAGGLAMVAAGCVGVSVGVAAGAIVPVVLAFTVIGAGLGGAAASGAELIMASAPPARAGSAAGVNETLVESSGALGVAVLGSVLAGGHSWSRPFPVATAATLLAAVAVVRFLRT